MKDFFKVRTAYLKQRLTITEKEKEQFEKQCKKERELKEELMRKIGSIEKKAMESSAELVA